MMFKGKVWKYGDNVDTDVIIPARYLNTSDPEELGRHAMEDIDPDFVKNVQKGDIIVAGRNFGSGSSRQHAPVALKASGISAVIAKSFARIFFRNAINIGLYVVEIPEAVDEAQTGDVMELDVSRGEAKNLTRGKSYRIPPVPDFLKKLMDAGGLVNYVRKRIEA
ncbi:MAG: 3-isopropylmalate dehydratase small subunit [Synergistetes bacterium]|nr:3-isopropylmalate dehydratase small subunit [Synergistota bacterium]